LRKISTIFLMVIMFSLGLGLPSSAKPSVEELLDDRTAFRWGKGFLAWVVHYPDYIVEPWVMEVTGGNGDPTGKVAEDFKKALRMDTSTPVLLSVYVYGGREVSLAPLSKAFFLRKDDGTEISPSYYEKTLDEPISDFAQGLVFFPKVEGPFKLVLKKGHTSELVFEFPDDMRARLKKNLQEEASRIAKAQSMTKEQRKETSNDSSQLEAFKEAAEKLQKEKEKLQKTIQELLQEREILKNRIEDLSLALEKERKLQQAQQIPKTTKKEAQKAETSLEPKEEKVVGYEREVLLDKFLEAWKAGDWDAIFSLLSPTMRAQLGNPAGLKKLFEEKHLPEQLPDRYEVKRQDDPNKVAVTFAPKILFVRTLRSLRLEMEKVDTGWLIGSLK